MALLLLKIMIQSFLCKETEALFNRFFTRKLPSDIHRTALRKLIILDSAESLIDLRVPPSNRLEKLLGDRKGQYSIRINERWRICFKWFRQDAYDVEIIDYH